MKDIPGFEGRYAVTEDGRVWSYPKIAGGQLYGKWLRQSTHLRGYKVLDLFANGARRGTQYRVHRLVALTYLEKGVGNDQVNHKNGIKDDNRVENLEWCDSKHNVRHAHAMGLAKPKPTKLTTEVTARLRADYSSGMYTQKQLAIKYKLALITISRIIRRKRVIDAIS